MTHGQRETAGDERIEKKNLQVNEDKIKVKLERMEKSREKKYR